MTPNADLVRVARALGSFAEQVVFVGGSTVATFMTDAAAAPPRYTDDVDVIVRVGSRVDYLVRVSNILRERGFKEDPREGAPLCRWVRGDMTIDVMPTDASILGFTNRWYEDGILHARELRIAEGLSIRVLSAPHFIATKVEAFHGRGKGDFLASADIEDIVRVVDGRAELADEIEAAGTEVRAYLRDEITRMLGNAAFMDALPGHLPGDSASQQRADVVLERLRGIAGGPQSP